MDYTVDLVVSLCGTDATATLAALTGPVDLVDWQKPIRSGLLEKDSTAAGRSARLTRAASAVSARLHRMEHGGASPEDGGAGDPGRCRARVGTGP